MSSPEHHTKSPKKSQYGKAPNLHNPKWPPNFNNVLYLGSSVDYLNDSNMWKGVFATRRRLGL